MRKKKIVQMAMFLASFLLAGCSQADKVPACSSKEAKAMLDNMAQWGYQRHNVSFRYEHSLTLVRTRKIEPSTGMRECAANFVLRNAKNDRSKTIPIVYWVLLLDDSKQPVIENENLQREVADLFFMGGLGNP